MPISNSPSTDNGPSRSERQEIDRCIEAFQGYLNGGLRPSLDDFLPSGPAAAAALIELVHVELEFRLKHGEEARVEEYLARYPQLAGDPAVVVELAVAEYEFRYRREPALGWESYAQRFPACQDVLARRLPAINALTGPKGNDPPAGTTVPIRPPTVVSHSLPLELAFEFRRMLRQRLRVLSVFYEIALLYLFVTPGLLQIETGHYHAFSVGGLAIGAATALSIGGIGAWLLKRRLPSLSTLRRVELLLHGCLVLFLASWQYDEFIHMPDHPLWSGEYEKLLVRAAACANSVNWFIILVVYGLLIPNTWQRCAMVSLVTSLIPLLLHGATIRHLGAEHGMRLLLGSSVTFAFADGLAIFGAYNISTLQHEVNVVRQQVRALGQYQLKRRLGGGSMGEVYLAEHALLKRPCAVKFIRPEVAGHPSYIARFEREVQAMARLAHPHIVEIYDYGRSEDGTFYYAMEYLTGLNLQQLVEQAGPLPPGRAVYFLRQISAALHQAHALGLIHRDVKPSNILVTQRGGSADFIKLLDFGLVRDHGEEQGQLTQTGLILGTPGYMSPEQAAGETSLDARTDIYSLGAVAYFLLSGRAPFSGRPAAKVIAAHVLESPPPLQEVRPDVPDDLAGVVAGCLARGVTERFADAGQVEQAFAACACAAEWSKEDAANWWRRPRNAEPLPLSESA